MEVVKLLVRESSCSVSTKDQQNGVTPLHLASAKGHLEIVRFLVSCDPSLTDMADKHQRTALHYACQGGCQEVVKVLVEELKSKTDARDILGVTPCQVARLRGHSEIVKYLSGGSEVGNSVSWPITMQILFLH